MQKTVLLLFLLLLLPLFVFAQKATFQLYTTADGLSSNTIWGLTQDSQGFIWVTTDDGFNRFDGQQFLNHTNSSDPVFTKTRKTGRLEVAGDNLYSYENNQISILNTVTGLEVSIPLSKYFPHNEKNWNGTMGKLANGEIVALLIDTEKNVAYLARLNASGIHRADPLPGFHDQPFKFTGDEKGNFIFTDNNVILKCTPEGVIKPVVQPDSEDVAWGLLAAGQNNSVFVNHGPYLSIIKAGSGSIQPHPITRQFRGTHLEDLVETTEGDLWISASGQHLFFYDASADQLHDFKPQLERIFPANVELKGIFLDDSGTIWVESVLGLLKVVPQQTLFDTYYTEKYDVCNGQCSFRGFAEADNGEVYASFYSNICKVGGNRLGAPVPLLKNEHTPFGMLFQEGLIYLNDGYVVDSKTGKKSNPFNSPAYPYDLGSLEKDNQGRLWWAWGWKLFLLEKKDGQTRWKPVGLEPKKHINALKFDPSSQLLWLGYGNGLAAFDPSTMELVFDSAIENPAVSAVHHLHTDGKGGIWAGTERGLVHFDPANKTWKKYTMADGLPHDFVHGIQPEGDSCLWLATNNGLSRFSIATERFVNFHKEDGLPDNEFNRGSSFRASDGRLYFGCMRGIAAFYPQAVMAKKGHRQHSGRLTLHAVSMTDDEQDTILMDYFFSKQPSIEVFYQNKTVTLDFGLIDHQNTGATQYTYLLDGHNDTWSNPSTNNTVTFSSLPSGQYVFRVRALNAKGEWVTEELAVQLTVHPPWWASWWAYSFYILALAGGAFGIFSIWKKRWALKNQLQLEQREAARLKELDNFKSRLYTNLTHEFRTPLTVILGMAEEGKLEIGNWEIGNPKTPQRMFSILGLIERNGQNLLRLINQLLDLSKLEDKSFKLDLQRGDVVPFLRYVTESFQTYGESRQLSIHFTSKLEKLEMDFDPEQLQQVLTNLISNAVKFTPAGGKVRVEIGKLEIGNSNHVLSTHEHANAEFPISQFLISISDTGIGISQKDLPHIFDRFYQVDGSTTRAGEGTGIGLAHSLELVKLMGGSIEVESEVGKGSTFQVKLPIGQSADRPVNNSLEMLDNILPTLAHRATSLHEKQPTSGRRPSSSDIAQLLLVEDNPDVVFYLKKCLSGRFDISVAENGRIGIEQALERIPDLILSDVMMPEKDGFEVCDFLKNDHRTSHIPIVLLTAKADVESRIKGLRRGADAYLSKPFQKDELLATLDMMLENKRRLALHFSKKQTLVLEKTPNQPGLGLETQVEVEVEEAIEVEDAFLQKLRLILEENHADPSFALPQLCEKVDMSRYQLFRKMKALTDESPSQFIRNFRMEQAKKLLDETDLNVSEVAWQVGFKDLAHFSKTFHEAFGQPPSEARKG